MRKKQKDFAGLALIAACALSFAAMLCVAYQADKANGISVSQSLKNWGF